MRTKSNGWEERGETSPCEKREHRRGQNVRGAQLEDNQQRLVTGTTSEDESSEELLGKEEEPKNQPQQEKKPSSQQSLSNPEDI